MFFAIGEGSLGAILVAKSEKGICAIFMGDNTEELTHHLQDRFPKTHLVGGDQKLEQVVATVIDFIAAPSVGCDLPLDIRGTSFQQRVWEVLRKIPLGSTATYTDISKQIGLPKAARAVAGACAANPLAVVIPCHRVIRSDGSLSGYRWGVERKEMLLKLESNKEN